ncbi:MAG: porphobilinogen synthase [Bacteroidota bacterium]
MIHRPRRNRKNAVIRSMVRETSISVSDFIYPLFLIEGTGLRSPVKSMPGIFRHSIDQVLHEIEQCLKLGLNAFALFPNIEEGKKDALATESLNSNGLYLRCIREIKKQFPESCLIGDVAMDPYSSDGHDGIVRHGIILNDETLEVLARMALAQAEAGIDIIAPSDMMDGRVGFIREHLDGAGFSEISILAYSAKYASAYYGPFRDALESAPRFGDKKTYQMDPANVREALREVSLDIAEGADMVMVKPAGAYLDVIRAVTEISDVPVAAYQVSGEYAMIKAAAIQGWIDGDKVMEESLLAIRRAGADIILSYFAKEWAEKNKNS